MTPQNIKSLLKQIQRLMYGYNYEVTLGVEVFENCSTLQDANQAIKKCFPDSNPESVMPLLISSEDLLEDITDKFEYRGDNLGVTVVLDKKQEQILKSKQNELKAFILTFVTPVSKVYNYPFLEGLPGYPVFWEYSFVILSDKGQCLFIYGSSSD